MGGTAQSLFFSSEATTIFCFQFENSKFFTLLARSSNYVDEPLVSILYTCRFLLGTVASQNLTYVVDYCYLLIMLLQKTCERHPRTEKEALLARDYMLATTD